VFRRLFLPVLAMILAASPAGPAVASGTAASVPPSLTAAYLSTTAPVIDAGSGCAYPVALTVKFYDPSHRITFAYGGGGAVFNDADGTHFSTDDTRKGSRSGDDVTFVSRAKLCGLDSGGAGAATYPGRYTWYFTAYHSPDEYLTVSRSFHLRHRAQMSFNASPEPVRKGGTVTLKASVSYGWEGYADKKVDFYFKADGASRYVLQGSAWPTCVADCFDGWDYLVATKRFRQTRAGVWKAVTAQDSWLSSATRLDRVAVR
jgi:hypothetical protein